LLVNLHLKNVQNIWRAGLNWSAGRIRPTGRSLSTPDLFQSKKYNGRKCGRRSTTTNDYDITHTVYTFKMMYWTIHVAATTLNLRFIDDCKFAKHFSI